MPWENFLSALIPVPAFYLIYFRYFTYKPVYSKHAQAFLSGIAYALLLVLASNYLFNDFAFRSHFLTGFVKAALIEKTGAFLIILFILRYYPRFSVMEGTLSAMMYGIGFSLVENLFYAGQFGFSIIIIRIIFSVPLHLTTCGMIGYYLSMRKMSQSFSSRTGYLAKGFFIAYLLHGTFDSLLISGGYKSYIAAPIMIIMVIILEFMLSRSQTYQPFSVLHAMNMRFEDWLTMDRQPRYERWILQSMGTPSVQRVHLFLWRPGIIRFLLVIFLMVIAIYSLSYRSNIMKLLNMAMKIEDQIILLGIFPVSLSLIIILVGAINPNFFQKSMIRIPIISDVELYLEGEFQEMLVTYAISPSNCFLRTSEKLGLGTRVKLRFECPSFSSEEINGEVIWENHTSKQQATGTIVRFDRTPLIFYRFMVRYFFFRLSKGLYFFLRLPGSETTRRLFMRPISTMQEERILPSGTIIFREGDRGTEFYLLKKGRVIFYKNKDTGGIITMDTIDAGNIFGEMSIVAGTPRAATAICATECIVAVADRENMDALIANNAQFTKTLVQALVERIKMSEKILVDQINSLEKEKMNSQRYFHASMMLLLIGLGYNPARVGMNSHVDMKKIAAVVKNMDDDMALELMNLVIQKQEAMMSNEDASSISIEDMIDHLYEKFNTMNETNEHEISKDEKRPDK
ncbi:MAG TPA: cyclic nucleotide-binding domain-containing protein [Spirochaetota bacterium]|nr:cyclic nucleotide-binding domain-containing protein [Spirochaetota bacterium]HPI88402.1 cyclic nucleotide-binding domain-containing protein [Spirochaetota bacterium]HPR46740.1 cyclic nucleotide-binding domain-containing protein [Spirochaetota bacterium]